MRILDRYCVRQLVPVWIWCLVVFVFLSCLIDLFGHLDEALRYQIPTETILRYYLNFVPFVFVRAAPLALLLSTAFVAGRLTRHQEFLAMNASGVSLLRASVPFLFVGWMASLLVFLVSEHVVPSTYMVYERIQRDAFREPRDRQIVENVAAMDAFNRLYHARELDVMANHLTDLTIIEHDWRNRPVKGLYAAQAVWTPHGWYLIHGTLHRLGPGGTLLGDPQPFVDRLLTYPVTPASFASPEARPDIMRYGQLRLLILRLKHTGITNLRRYQVELASKVTFPLMNLVIGLIGFVGSTRPSLRGNLRGLGLSLGWGILYYLGVAVCQGIAKQWPIPVVVMVWVPHLAATGWCARKLFRSS